MIVRNEAQHLERCLQSAAPFVDEVVIVDTGSTDGTQEIAKRYATIYDEIPWPDDFSAARNHGINLATGDYIVILDADEYTPVRGNWATLRALLVQEKPTAVAFQIVNHLPGGQILSGDYIWQIRVFLNDPKLRYEGSVHNQIAPVIVREIEEPKIMQLKFTVEHDGYNLSPERMQGKYAERLDLVKQEVERAQDEKQRNYYLFQLAKSYFMMKDYELTYDTLHILDLSKLTDENGFDACILGVHTSSRKEQQKEANVYASHALDIWPHEPMSLFLKGACLLGLGRFESARTILLGCLYYVENPQGTYKYSVDREFLCEAIGDACFHTERLGEAKHFYRIHLSKYPDNERVKAMDENIIPVGGDSPPLDPQLAVQEIGQGNTIRPLLQTD